MEGRAGRRLKILLAAAGALLLPVLVAPLPRFRAPLSTVVEARDGSLLGARIAADGQWRFPGQDSVSEKFGTALVSFEDRYFYYHPGVNLVSVFRALVLNIRSGKIVSGGSTLSMQVARLSRGNRPRTYPEKFIEVLSALKLELFRSKKTILGMYMNNAPFGGNTVGIGAAAWRYYGKSPSDLTWAEAAALAVLPNAPSLVFPGKNQETLGKKRDALLKRLFERGIIDSLTWTLALDEPLPSEPQKMPSGAVHLTEQLFKREEGKIIRTTIDPAIQQKAFEIVNSHQKKLAENFIFNSACIIVETSTGNVLAYVGNSEPGDAASHGEYVDIIHSRRSTGSILKPLLYAAMLESGDLLPDALIADVPTRFPGFSPKNFDQSYSGAVPASAALSQSLNIPAVRMLQAYNPERFMNLLKRLGFTSFTGSADHYGLSLILGGGEASLWELTGVYASLSRVLNRYNSEKQYFKGDYHPPVLVQGEGSGPDTARDDDPPLSAASVWLTYEALTKVNRPESETGWQYFSSVGDVAFKTGTSFGFRDGWAVGTTPAYVVGVWVGNANGEGRPGLTGITAAAPVLFDLVSLMGHGQWFSPPYGEMTRISICTASGCLAGPDCPETREADVSANGVRSPVCPFHHIIHLNRAGSMQVNSGCEDPAEIVNVPWFVLPPSMEFYYRKKHPDYRTLPPVSPGCKPERSIPVMEFIYPGPGIKIFIPRDQSGDFSRIVAEVAHRSPAKKLFWHLDEKYLGSTRNIHQTEFLAEKGEHILTVVDEDGNTIKCPFSVAGRVR